MENDGKALDGDVMRPLNLDDIWPLVKETHFTEHSVWKDFPGQAAFLERYKKFADAFCKMGEYLFRQLPSFQHLPKVQPPAASMRHWANKLPEQLKEWVNKEDLSTKVEATFFRRCAENLRSVFSAGLAAVAQVVAQAKTGDTPLTQQSVDELLSKVSADHPLRELCAAFLQAGVSGNCFAQDLALFCLLEVLKAMKRQGSRLTVSRPWAS